MELDFFSNISDAIFNVSHSPINESSYLMNGTSVDSFGSVDGEDYCHTFIPGRNEYYTALGWIWIMFMIMGIPTCFGLYFLFMEQLVHIINNAHSVFRDPLLWICSVYPFMALMTVIGFVIPRSQAVCYTVKVLYMVTGISKFADLTILMYGSEEVMLWTVQDTLLKTNVGPVCCCCPFLPKIEITKKRLRFLIAGVRQLPFTQAFYLITLMILQSANEVVVGSLHPSGSYFWLNLFSTLTSLLGAYSLNLLANLSQDHLHRYCYNKLSFVLRMLIIITKFQDMLFSIMAYYEVFPCTSHISHYVYRQTVENFVYIFEMLAFGIYSYKCYRNVSFVAANPTIVRFDARGNILPHHLAYLPSLSGHVDDQRYDGIAGVDILDNAEYHHGPAPINGSSHLVTTGQEVDFSGSSLVICEDNQTFTNGYEIIN